MEMLDLRPAADRMARLLDGVAEKALYDPTPCPEYCLGDLIDHVAGLARVFTASAIKDLGPATTRQPSADASCLEPGWRVRIADDLTTLAEAWRSPKAWEGMTQAAGVDLPGEMAGRIVLDELVVHAWDIAKVTGQPFECDDETLQEVEAAVRQVRGGNDGEIPGLFGAVLPVPDDAPPLHRVLGLTGRDREWTPA